MLLLLQCRKSEDSLASTGQCRHHTTCQAPGLHIIVSSINALVDLCYVCNMSCVAFSSLVVLTLYGRLMRLINPALASAVFSLGDVSIKW